MSERKPYDNIDPHEYLASDELEGGEHEHHVHLTPFWPMFWVFVILLALTALTVWTSNVHAITIGNTTVAISGTAHVLMAMSIAVVKSVLVAAFFMHLLYDKKVNSIVMTSTIFAVSLFIGLTLMDLDVRGMTTDIERGEIFPGGNVSLYNKMEGAPRPPQDASTFEGNIIEYAAQSHAQVSGNPDGHATPPVGGPEQAHEAGAMPEEAPVPETDGH